MTDLARALADELVVRVFTAGSVDTTRPRCAVPQGTHLADVGRLCDAHLQQLNGWLREVEVEARYVDAVPTASDQFSPGTGGGAPAFTRTPVRLDAVVLTDHRQGTGWAEDEDDRRAAGPTAPTLVVLRRWADRVREHRILTPPSRHTIHTERVLLTNHLDWCARQPWIGRMHRQVGTLRDALVRVNGGEDDRPLPVPCPTCRGPLMPDRSRVVCGINPTHTWTGTELARLALATRKDAP